MRWEPSVRRYVKLVRWPVVVLTGFWLLYRHASDWAFVILTSDRVNLIDATKALMWPVVVLIALALLYRPLSVFLEGLGQRITKLSVFKVELELVAHHALKPLPSPAVDEIKGALQVGDSSASLLKVICETGAADYAVIDLGSGDEWLTSRLFILAAMLPRMRSTRCFVFVTSTSSHMQRFLGVASVQKVRWCLARVYPWLETVYSHAYYAQTAQNYPSCAVGAAPGPWNETAPTGSSDLIRSDDGTIDIPLADQIVRRYIQILGNLSNPALKDDTWCDLLHNRVERASWVAASDLMNLLGGNLQDSWVSDHRREPASAWADAVMRQRDDFVAVLGRGGRFNSLVDRQALLKAASRAV
jgi:hypothetical protein